MRTFTTNEVAELAKVTPRQLNHWVDHNVLAPVKVPREFGRGRGERAWTCGEVRVAWALGQVDADCPMRTRIASVVGHSPLARFLVIEHGGDVYTVDNDQSLIGAVLEASGLVSVLRLKSTVELTELLEAVRG